jgi:hypothetical protein
MIADDSDEIQYIPEERPEKQIEKIIYRMRLTVPQPATWKGGAPILVVDSRNLYSDFHHSSVDLNHVGTTPHICIY